MKSPSCAQTPAPEQFTLGLESVSPQDGLSKSDASFHGIHVTSSSKGTPAAHLRGPRHLRPVGVAPIIDFDLEKYLAELNLAPAAEAYVRKAIASPSRNPTGYISHTIYYPCFKYGYVLSFESRDIEYAVGLTLIYRADVLGVYEQPPVQYIDVKIPNGGNYSLDHTPDFLVLTTQGIEIWEGKPSVKLAAAKIKNPNRYQEINGRYRSPAVEKHYNNFGFSYFIATEQETNPHFVRAARELTPYLTGHASPPIKDDERRTFIDFVRTHPGTTLSAVPIQLPARRAELAFHLLAHADVFTSWSDANFTEPGTLRLYPTAQDEQAFHDFLEMNRPRPASLDELGYRLTQGALIEIGATQYSVTRLAGDHVVLSALDEPDLPLSFRELLDLRPRIGRIVNAEKTFELMFREGTPEDRRTYSFRKAAILPYLQGGQLAGQMPKCRKIRAWRDAYIRNCRNGRPGDEAIFPKFYRCGRKPRMLAPDVQAAFEKLVKEQYLTPKKRSHAWFYRALGDAVGSDRLPKERMIRRRLAAYDRHLVTLRQEGKRVAADSAPVFGDSPIFGSPNRDRSFVRAHIDSTPLDLSLPDEPRQSLCKMVDGFDGRILAWVLEEGAPNAMTIRALILDCISRHGAIPAELTCDWGKEHQNLWIRKSLAHMNVVLDYRAKATPRQGSAVEGAFSILCAELVHNLEGQTHLMKRVRMLTQAVDPRQFALWRAADLQRLLSEYCDLRNDLPSTTRPSPNAIAQASAEKFGPAPRQFPSHDEMAELLLPLVKGGTRKVSKRGTIRHKGKTFGEIGMKRSLLAHSEHKVEVRELPADPNTILVILQRPRKTVRLKCVNCSGPSADIIETAQRLDQRREETLAAACEPSTPAERKSRFTADVIHREADMKRRPKVVPFPRRGSELDIADIPALDLS